MTGAVFVIFTAAGIWLFGGSVPTLPTLGVTGDWPAAAAALAIVAFPMIGITIQGAHYFAASVFSDHPWFRSRPWLRDNRWFEDRARKLVKRVVTESISECSPGGQMTESDWRFIRNAPADAFFVWIYHDLATPHMIEWARRRRSYSYLGWNWFLAAIGGMAAAALVVATRGNEQVRRELLLLVGILWSLAALWAAARMRHDADSMEAIWAVSRINPDFRDCIRDALPELFAAHGHARKAE